MHQAVVRRRVRALYSALSAGDPEPMLAIFARRFAYTFVGENHPLAGTRRTPEAMRAQLERVLRLFPGMHFEVKEVLVAGPVWDTRVGVVVDVRARLLDGSPYRNDILQLLRLRWGRVVAVRTVTDTTRLRDAYRRLQAVGVAEATAQPVS